MDAMPVVEMQTVPGAVLRPEATTIRAEFEAYGVCLALGTLVDV